LNHNYGSMDLTFDDFALIIEAPTNDVPFGLKDEVLFLTIKAELLEILSDHQTPIYYFGYAPDNTADGQDELMTNGVFYRIIAYEKNLGVDFESSPIEILTAFRNLVENYPPFWSTIFIDKGQTKKQITIELMYQEIF
jgi:hypothetical protein